MALVKKPKAALARLRAKKSQRKRKKLVPVTGVEVVTKTSPLDSLIPGGAFSKKATAKAAPGTNVHGVDIAPHGLSGNIPLGVRTPPHDEPIQVLQIAEDFCGACEAERFVARTLIEEFRQRYRKRDDGVEWFAWIGTVSYHSKGLIFWVGLSSDAPKDIFDILDDVIRAMGFATARSTAIPGRVGLSPLLYLGDDGLELLRMI